MTIYRKNANWLWAGLTILGLCGVLYFGWQLHQLRTLNQ